MNSENRNMGILQKYIIWGCNPSYLLILVGHTAILQYFSQTRFPFVNKIWICVIRTLFLLFRSP
jgi:hypothetical protein